MNISSAVIKVLPENSEALIQRLKDSGLCEFHFSEKGNIVITIEGENVKEEIGKLRQIEKFPHVISAELIYSYCEDELEKEKDKLEISTELPSWLNDENATAEDIRYNGDVKKHF